mmetsp:Transcript_148833/g.370858  ORF Transcript_148833/g.370858 Transcript_148833/m.370858 type:complete len:201 (-) Transcript_148833:683-1285(-)
MAAPSSEPLAPAAPAAIAASSSSPSLSSSKPSRLRRFASHSTYDICRKRSTKLKRLGLRMSLNFREPKMSASISMQSSFSGNSAFQELSRKCSCRRKFSKQLSRSRSRQVNCVLPSTPLPPSSDSPTGVGCEAHPPQAEATRGKVRASGSGPGSRHGLNDLATTKTSRALSSWSCGNNFLQSSSVRRETKVLCKSNRCKL